MLEILIANLVNSLDTPNETACAAALFQFISGFQSSYREAVTELWKRIPHSKRQMYVSEIQRLIHQVPSNGDYPVDVAVVFRGCATPPSAVRANGFLGPGKATSLVEHVRETGSSIYVSTTKDRQIAEQHARSHAERTGRPGYIYKIRAERGIDCASWFSPSRFHAMEQEVVFPNRVPAEDVIEYSCKPFWDSFQSL